MKVIRSYAKGIQLAILRPKMIGTLWIVNFVFGSVMYFLFTGMFSAFAGKSLFADKLLKEFDFNFLFEFLVHYRQTVNTIFSVTFILVCGYFLISIFLNGGILFSLVHTRKPDDDGERRMSFAPVFFQGGGKFFGRFFRLSMYSLILWTAFIIFFLLLNLLSKFLTSSGTKEQLSFYLFWIKIGMALFILFFMRMILDYARIKIVSEDSRFVFRSFYIAIKFAFKKLGKTLALYYLLLITGGILLAVYLALSSILPAVSFLAVLLVFIIRQGYIASQGWLRIAFLSAQLKFYWSQALET